MDSLTQIVLGAAVGELVLGKKIGWKAQCVGAIAGTIPDLDVFVSMMYPDAMSELLIHRSYSHALFVHLLLAIPFAYLSFLIFRKRQSFISWYMLWMLALTTHAILDSFTTYGTQLFLPFTNYLVGFNNISVIDPLYTLPFMALLIVCLCLKKDDPRRYKWAWTSVIISSAYMAMTFGTKAYIHDKFDNSLKEQNIAYTELSTSPTFFNNALWAGIACNDTQLTVGEFSVFQRDKWVDFVSYKRNLHLENGFESKELNTLKWFSQGKYFLEMGDSNTLRMYIVKWGRSDFSKTSPKEAFIFYYELDKNDNGQFELRAIQPSFDKVDMKAALYQLWSRIWRK